MSCLNMTKPSHTMPTVRPVIAISGILRRKRCHRAADGVSSASGVRVESIRTVTPSDAKDLHLRRMPRPPCRTTRHRYRSVIHTFHGRETMLGRQKQVIEAFMRVQAFLKSHRPADVTPGLTGSAGSWTR